MTRTLLFTLALLASSHSLPAAPPVATDDIPVGRSVGERFPAVRLPALADGAMTSLSAFRGQKVLLFEFASW